MALFGFGKKKAEAKAPEVTRDQIINENRERANRVITALQVMRKKIDVDMMNIDVDKKQSCIDGIRSIENLIATSPANDKEDAVKIDTEIKNCLDIMLKAVDRKAMEPVENSVECIGEAVRVRAMPDDKNIQKIKMYVSKAKISLEIMLTQSIIEYRKNVCEEAAQKKEELTKQINEAAAKGADFMSLMPKYDDVKQLDAKIKDYENDIELREKMLTKLKDSIDQINLSVKNESILSQEELAKIYQLLEAASTEALLDIKGKFEVIQEHDDVIKAESKLKEEILNNLRTTNYATMMDTGFAVQKNAAEVKAEPAAEVKKEAEPVQTVRAEEQAIMDIL